MELPKTHYFDAVSICSDKKVELESSFFLKKHVSKGDYQQRTGKRSEKKIPTGKLFGLKKFDLIETEQGVGIVKGKRSSGYFAITDIMGNKIHDSAKVKQNCKRLRARTTTLIEQKVVSVKVDAFLPHLSGFALRGRGLLLMRMNWIFHSRSHFQIGRTIIFFPLILSRSSSSSVRISPLSSL